MLGSGQLAANDNARVLAWIKPQSGGGTLTLLGMDGSQQVVLDVPANASIVTSCGENAISPNGKYAIIFIGTENNGALYLMEDDAAPVLLYDGLSAMACVGFHGIQFSPDSRLVGFLSYQPDFVNETSPISRLLVYDTGTRQQVGNFENIAAFHMTSSNTLVYASFFKNVDKHAVEVAVTVWDGANQREVATLFSDESLKCFFINASTQSNQEGSIALALGYRCNQGQLRTTQFQFYTIDANTRATTLLLSGQTGGQYFASTRTNGTFIAPNGRTLYVAMPDGLASNTGSLNAVSLDTPTLKPVVPQYGVFATLRPPANRAISHGPVLSQNGAWVALAANDANENGTLYLIELDKPELNPITLRVGGRGDTVTDLFFNNENTQLFYVSGGANGGNNAAFLVNLATGVEERLVRGRYGEGVLSTDGGRVALLNWISFADNKPMYPSIVALDLKTAQQVVLYEGGQVVDNNLVNPQTLRVIAWRSRP